MTRSLCSFGRSPHRSGVTMIEVVVSTMLVGMVLVGAMYSLESSVRIQVDVDEMSDGPRLAESLLAEIMAQPYADSVDGGAVVGVDSGESADVRTDFDDVDDYAGWSKSSAEARDGSAISGASGWQRSVDVTWADRLTGSPFGLYDPGFKRIIVTVTSPDGEVTTRTGYRDREGALEQLAVVDQTVVTHVGGSLTLGNEAKSMSWGTNLLNHVNAPSGITATQTMTAGSGGGGSQTASAGGTESSSSTSGFGGFLSLLGF